MPDITMGRSRLRLGLGGLLVVLLMAAGTYVLGARSQSAPDGLRPDDPQVVNAGARIYTQHCAACHGTRGQGQPDWRERGPDGLLPAPPHDESGHTWHHPDAQLFAITKYGLAKLIQQPDYQTNMPIYDGVLNDSETLGDPRLLVIGRYRMGFEVQPTDRGTQLRVWIDFDLPARGLQHGFGRILGSFYAHWCVRQMVREAERTLISRIQK